MSYSLNDLNERGQLVVRSVSHGFEAAVVPQLFNAKITLGKADDDTGYEQEWSYVSVAEAIEALRKWDPDYEWEPRGWIRHLPSNRRRKDGDPATEVVRP